MKIQGNKQKSTYQIIVANKPKLNYCINKYEKLKNIYMETINIPNYT